MVESQIIRDVHERALIVDGLHHSLLVDPPPGNPGETPLDQLISAGVSAINVSVALDIYPSANLRTGLADFHNHLILFDAFPDRALAVSTSADIERAKRERKLAVIFGVQGTSILEGDLRWPAVFHRLGLRIAQLTYNERGAAGCGCLERDDSGLTYHGTQLIREFNRLGVVVDLSHAGKRTSLEAAEVSEAPIVFSHSGVYALVQHPRNLNDEQIIATASSGGVIGLCPHSIMCQRGSRRPSLQDFVDQIDYVVNLVGVNHVGIGTDRFMQPTLAYQLIRTSYERTVSGFFGQFDGNQKHVSGFSKTSDWSNLTAALLTRGYSEAETLKILGGNFMRVFRAVWG